MLSGHGARAGEQEVPAADDKFTYPKVCREIIKAGLDTQCKPLYKST